MTADAPEPATRPQPATPLPWKVSPYSSPAAIVAGGLNVAFMSRTRPQHRDADATYLVYAANELPKLVAQRARLVAALEDIRRWNADNAPMGNYIDLATARVLAEMEVNE